MSAKQEEHRHFRYLRWATTWTQWIFDNNLVDHTSVAWIPAAASSTAPILGSNQRYREVSTPPADAPWPIVMT